LVNVIFLFAVLLSMEFRELVGRFRWRSFEDYLGEEDSVLAEDVRFFRRVRGELRRFVEGLRGFRDRLRRIDLGRVDVFRSLLYEGRVCGVDGTIAVYPTPIGVKCRIGVIAVNYAGGRLEKVVYVSDANLIDEELRRVDELLSSLERVVRFSRLLYRTVMLYEERRIALERDEDWRIVHGPLIPLEFRLGRLGVEGVLEACLELGAKLIDDGHVIGVLSSTNRLRIASLGYILNPGEYLYVGELGRIMEAEKRRLTAEEESLVDDFISKYGSKVALGIYRVGARSFVFEARKDFFDDAAHLIIADSLNNRFKGFPLLLDYADSMCRTLLNSSDFERKIENMYLIEEGEEGLLSFDERRLRG